jgi:hypothetical protein
MGKKEVDGTHLGMEALNRDGEVEQVFTGMLLSLNSLHVIKIVIFAGK